MFHTDDPQILSIAIQHLVVHATLYLGFVYPYIKVLHYALQGFCYEKVPLKIRTCSKTWNGLMWDMITVTYLSVLSHLVLR
jgi:hypothetical protein